MCGIAIIEILDKYYGNLIVHTLSEEDETILASHLAPIIKDHVLELIQFRSNFTYRDTFIHMGFKEKERARMIHHDIGQYASLSSTQTYHFQHSQIMTTQYVVILATMPTNIANTLNATKYTTPSKTSRVRKRFTIWQSWQKHNRCLSIDEI